MKPIPNSNILFRLIGMVAFCWVAPWLVAHYLGPAIGVLGALGAGALWYSQYRFPARRQRSGFYFWFVASGYGVIGFTLLLCLGRLLKGS